MNCGINSWLFYSEGAWRPSRGHNGLGRLWREILTGVDEPVVLEVVLLVVQLLVPPIQTDELRVGAPLDDLAVLEHEDLIRAPNRREPVRDDEGRAALPERA